MFHLEWINFKIPNIPHKEGTIIHWSKYYNLLINTCLLHAVLSFSPSKWSHSKYLTFNFRRALSVNKAFHLLLAWPRPFSTMANPDLWFASSLFSGLCSFPYYTALRPVLQKTDYRRSVSVPTLPYSFSLFLEEKRSPASYGNHFSSMLVFSSFLELLFFSANTL